MNKIPELHVGRGTTIGPVTVFPVWAEIRQLRGLASGPAATVSVGELKGGAQVPRLTVSNLGTKPVLLLEGELLEGGMQTRALAYDLLIAAGASEIVEVACVEQGRWHGTGRHERRARKVGSSVKRGLRREDGGRQGDVWASVARFEHVVGSTASGSFADQLDLAEEARAISPDVAVLAGQTGVIVGVAGWPVALELFGSTGALRAHLPGIVEAALMDATLVDSAVPVSGRRARDFACALSGVVLDSSPALAGEGRRIDSRTDTIEVRGIAVDDGQLAHVSALNLRHQLIGAH